MPTDAHAIRALVWAGRINPTGLDWQRFLVATTPRGEIIGCGQVKPHRDGTLELASVVVAPAWRGRGIAQELIANLVQANPGDMYLMCRSKLGPLYAKFGFIAVTPPEMPPFFRWINGLAQLAKFFLKEGEDLLVMKRRSETA